MEDIGKLPWVKEVVNDCKSFIKFIKNHHMANATFLDFFSNGAILLKPAATRFATNIIMLDRAWTLSSSLRQMVISDRWISWANDPQRSPKTRTDAREAKETILDERFWNKVHDIVTMMEKIFVLLRQVDSLKDFLGRTNIIHTTAMLLNPAYLFDEERQEFSYHSFIMRDFQEAWSSYAYVHSLSGVRLSISRQHKLVYIYHNARVNNIDQKRERKSAAVLNTFMKSNTQQSILKQRHGTEYGSTSNPRDAWIPDDVLQENGPEVALSNGEKVRVKTWDLTEPVSAEEVLEDTLQARIMRNAPVDGKHHVGSTEPMENIVYYDDLADHDFPDDSKMSLDDSAVLPGMEVRDEDTLDAYFNVTSEVLPIEAIRNYTIVDEIDKTKARTLGVGEERLKQLNSRFGVARFPHVTLNVPGVTLTTKKTRILQEIYSMLGRRTDSFDLGKPPKRPKHYSSRLKPTERARTSQQWENVVGPLIPIPDNGVGPSQREEPYSPTRRLLRQLPLVDYRSQLNPANVSRPPREDIADSAIPVEDNRAGPLQREESSSPRGRSLRQQAPVDYKSQLNPPK
ncbi:hypothetical protein R1sor_013102 [Riccia sorocarpa]|uniref:Uncharacterized protein n=1 Tax=Riccia sorocarpa TaxID=122646 RepID=A0ABD3H5J5_9MARC